ncbi:MAG: hypothetical protein ACD_77C00437G0001 [uncultured bacterium]|nr:MAG: hypothetical protein ACD_77C00437G0001 [uncultured bacterium]HBY01815.1 hypothetical protein [Rikenellaceae bacterium]
MRGILLILILAFNISTAIAQSPKTAPVRVVERMYIATDRDAYVAGEPIWISLYCFDISTGLGRLSSFSSVAYIELQNALGTSITTKIAINNGRGAGRIELPPVLATGNYRIVAYTGQMLNEVNPAFSQKQISVYNTLTSERVPGNVVVGNKDSIVVEEFKKKTSFDETNKSVDVRIYGNNSVIPSKSRIPLTVTNTGSRDIDVHISIVRNDSLPAPAGTGLLAFLKDLDYNTGNVHFANGHTADYEGEVIKVKVTPETNEPLTDKVIWLSAAGGLSDIYTTLIDSSGRATFFTNSVFGDRELVLDVPEADTNITLTYEMADHFVKPSLEPLPKLILQRNISETLKRRSQEMQVWRRFIADTLFEKIKLKKDPLLTINSKLYKLDDYTRFPVMKEVVSEFIPELRFRKVDEKTYLQMILSDQLSNVSISKYNTLVLLDGIPVFDHSKILNYDPLKVKSINVYNGEFLIGYLSFNGIASFETYKRDYSGLKFNRNTRILDFKGVQFPSRFIGKEVRDGKKNPDMRSVIYWDPMVSIKKGDNLDLTLITPNYEGEFIITIEGVDSEGKSIVYKKEFSIK